MPATSPFHTKICGVRFKSDIVAVEASPADAVGLNFFPPSVRYVAPEEPVTAELCRSARDARLASVGVFVNESAERIIRVADRLGLDHVQLHGDESPTLARQLVEARLSVIRAIKLPPGPLAVSVLQAHAAPWAELGVHLLLDADAGSAHGGSGRRLHWPSIRQWAEVSPRVRWTLAGGLSVANVAEAIRLSGAKSVDVASGVEHPRGKKSPELIEKFARLASAI